MLKLIAAFVQETLKAGIGQAILAFSLWAYTGIVFVFLLFAALRSLYYFYTK